ncbi:MAG: hypothetical protein IPG68_12380 [Micrococcales bacterium]|nr:hypothetical protein [Micrococcales bacterium]
MVILAAPASADTRTVYMTTSDSCVYDCAVAVMQVKRNKIRFKMSPAQANGISSIGWMRRRGDTVRGLVGGFECYPPTKETRQVSGRGSRTHFVDLQVTSRAQARAFANRHSDLGVSLPDWPWGVAQTVESQLRQVLPVATYDGSPTGPGEAETTEAGAVVLLPRSLS